MSLTIHPMNLGEGDVETSFLAFSWTPGNTLRVPFTSYLILGGPTPVVVDAGVRPEPGAENDVGSAPIVGPEHSLDGQLARHGLEPGDVGILTFTHLHADHTGLADRFPNARLLVQRSELQYAAAPLFPDYLYDRTDIAKLVGPLWPQVELLDGDTEMIAGVRGVVTGGHSPGHQMLYVKVDSGTAIITGDTMYVAKPAIELGLPPGYVVSMPDALAAIAQIKRDADHVLPMHDFAVYDAYPQGVS